MNILDPRFQYTPSISTDVLNTWMKFGFKPTTEAERIARQDSRRARGGTRAPYQPAQASDSQMGIYKRAAGAH